MERLGRELSASQLDFMKIQHRKNELAAVGKKRKRSTEEDAEFKKFLINGATNKQIDPDHYIHDGGLVISRRSS